MVHKKLQWQMPVIIGIQSNKCLKSFHIPVYERTAKAIFMIKYDPKVNGLKTAIIFANH